MKNLCKKITELPTLTLVWFLEIFFYLCIFFLLGSSEFSLDYNVLVRVKVLLHFKKKFPLECSSENLLEHSSEFASPLFE